MSLSPLALPQCPGGDDPEADHEHQQHRPGTDGHQGLQHEPEDGESEFNEFNKFLTTCGDAAIHGFEYYFPVFT